MAFFTKAPIMQTYYSNLEKIHQQTMQLEYELCISCGESHLVSHGYIYKKDSSTTEPVPVGKRVICSKRYGRTGCGRTMQLYLDSRVRYLHYAGCCVVAFVCWLMAGITISEAYQDVTGTEDPRNAYRWLSKLSEQFSVYRSHLHKPRLDEAEDTPVRFVNPQRRLLASTFHALSDNFGHPLCERYQQTLQTTFL